MVITVLCLLIIGCFPGTDAECSFPSDIRDSVWISSEFGDITFGTNVATFVDKLQTTTSNWTCHVSSGNKYVLKSVEAISSPSLGLIYHYYCFDFHQQSTASYLYYHPTILEAGLRRLQIQADTTTVSFACSESIDAAEYHVMVKSDTASSVKNICVSPLLGNFLYACGSGSTDNGTLNVCDTSSQTVLTFNHSQCSSDNVLYSASGVLNCVAQTSATISSETVYYQSLYNTDATVNDVTTKRFVCLAVSQGSSGAASFSYRGDSCESGQTSTTATGVVLSFETLVSTELCPIPESTENTESTESTSNTTNIGLIIGLVVGIILLLIIVGALIFYFCFYKRDPNAGKPIVENTKPRFEDPDKDAIIEDLELIDTRSTPVTRDEITFEAMSPTVLSNGKIPNGNPVSMTPTGTHTGNFFQNGVANGSLRQDSGIAMTDKSSSRPTPRIGMNPSKESMVIFNGDEKVISGNDTRIVPNENPNAQTFQMNYSLPGDGPLTLEGLDDEESDELGELSPHRENMPYPSLPREKSNLMPPIETTDPEKEKET